MEYQYYICRIPISADSFPRFPPELIPCIVTVHGKKRRGRRRRRRAASAAITNHDEREVGLTANCKLSVTTTTRFLNLVNSATTSTLTTHCPPHCHVTPVQSRSVVLHCLGQLCQLNTETLNGLYASMSNLGQQLNFFIN